MSPEAAEDHRVTVTHLPPGLRPEGPRTLVVSSLRGWQCVRQPRCLGITGRTGHNSRCPVKVYPERLQVVSPCTTGPQRCSSGCSLRTASSQPADEEQVSDHYRSQRKIPLQPPCVGAAALRLVPLLKRKGGGEAAHPYGASATPQTHGRPGVTPQTKPKEHTSRCETTDLCAACPLANSATFPHLPEAVKLHKLARRSSGLPWHNS